MGKEAMPPKCPFWNFQLNNYWMESLDFNNYPVWVNKHTAKYEPDGSVRIVVAQEDPGVGNWIDTVGHERGTMGLRWIVGKSREEPQPQTRVVKVADLEKAWDVSAQEPD